MTFDNFSQVLAFVGGLFACLLGLVAVLRQFAVKPLVKYLQFNVIDPMHKKLDELEEHLEEQINQRRAEIDAVKSDLDTHIIHSNLRAAYAHKERQLILAFMGIKIGAQDVEEGLDTQNDGDSRTGKERSI